MLLRSSWRHLRQQRGLTALALIAIGLAVALCVAVWQTNSSAVASFATTAQRLQGDATHTIQAGPAGISSEWYAAERRSGALRLASPKISARVLITADDVDGTERRERATLLGIDPFAAGELVSDFGFDGVFAADDLSLALRGDLVVFGREGRWPEQVTVWHGERQHTVRVVAASEALVYLPDMLIADLATADVLLGAAGQLTSIEVKVNAAGAAALSDRLPAGAVLRPASALANDLDALTAAFRLNLGALAALACLVAVYLVVSTITLWTVERQPWFAHLRAIGATPGQLVRVIFSEALLLGFVGAVLGFVTGQAVAVVTSALTARTVQDFYANVPILSAGSDVTSLVLALLLGPALTVVAALPAAWQCWHLTPRQQSLQRQQTQARRSLWLALGGLALGCLTVGAALIAGSTSLLPGWLGILLIVFGGTALTPLAIWAGMLALRPVVGRVAPPSVILGLSWPLRSLQRLGPAAAALTLALAASLGVAVMVQAFRDNVTAWLERVLAADIYVSPEGTTVSDTPVPLPPSLVDQVRALVPEAQPTTVAGVDVVTDLGDRTVPWSVSIIASDAPLDFTTTGGADPATVWQQLLDGAILMSEPLAMQRGLVVGDSLRLDGVSGTRALPIAALVTDFTPDGGRVTMHQRTALALGWDIELAGISLRLPDHLTAEQRVATRDLVAQELAALPVAVQDTQSLRALSLELFDRTFTITAVLQVLTAVVAAAGMIVAGMAHQLERRREWALLRSMGAAPPHVGRVLISGQVVLGLGAGLVAVPFGIVMAWLLAAVVNLRSFGWSLQLAVSPALCLQTVVIAVLTAAIAGWLPARLINRTPLPEAMRWE